LAGELPRYEKPVSSEPRGEKCVNSTRTKGVSIGFDGFEFSFKRWGVPRCGKLTPTSAQIGFVSDVRNVG